MIPNRTKDIFPALIQALFSCCIFLWVANRLIAFREIFPKGKPLLQGVQSSLHNAFAQTDVRLYAFPHGFGKSLFFFPLGLGGKSLLDLHPPIFVVRRGSRLSHGSSLSKLCAKAKMVFFLKRKPFEDQFL